MSDKIRYLVVIDGEEAFEIAASSTVLLSEEQLESVVEDFLRQTMPIGDYDVKWERIDKEVEDG